MPEQLLWAPHAWVDGRWADAVLLGIDTTGHWSQVDKGVSAPPPGARRLPGPVLPGLVDAHSHAFQRAFAGLSERRDSDADDFWSWRDRMYRVAQRITPEQMQAVASHLYVELLRGGYTQVCEFHYLHHGPAGAPLADRAGMCQALVAAAAGAGIGLTVLPVLYERAGFAQTTLRQDQQRFASTPALVHHLMRDMQALGLPLVNAGVAIHSLRAASASSITELLWQVGDADVPIHIHVAEQTQEVDDCLAATGQRPIDWLCRELVPDARWQLVHATHATPGEIDAVGRSGAGIVLCPGTEGNLGDGLCDLPGWLRAGVPMAIGSDSHVTRNWPEELRWLEYGQRLLRRQRNVAASPQQQPATAARLWNAALAAGGRAAGQARWGITPGARADALVVDTGHPALVGITPSHLLDALVFAGEQPHWHEVLVAGQVVLQDGHHAHQNTITTRFAEVMHQLWSQG
jgi:formimidoylglutamate deiminase